MAQCATTALAGAVPRPCVRGARGRFGGLRSVPGVVSLSFPPSRPACPALRVAGHPVRVSLTLARWYAIRRGLCVPQARSGCPSGSPRVPFACVCARAPAASAPPPWVAWRAHLARSRHWALVGPFHVVRAPPRVVPRSLAPSGVLGGGRSGPGSPLLGLGLWGWRKGVPGGGAFDCCEGRLRSGAPPPPTVHPRGGLLGSATHVLWARACGCGGPTLSPWPARSVGAACRGGGGGPSPYLAWGCPPPVGRVRGVRVPGGGLGGGGRPVRRAPRLCCQGGACRAGGPSASFRPSAFPGQATKWVSLASFWSCGAWSPYHSGSCSPAFTGRDLCGVLARWRGLACSPRFLWELAAGAGERAVLRHLSRAGGGGGPSPLPQGAGAGAPRLAGRWGGLGGGSRRGLPAPPLGGGPRFPSRAPILSSAHSPPACAFGRGRGAAPGGGGG